MVDEQVSLTMKRYVNLFCFASNQSFWDMFLF